MRFGSGIRDDGCSFGGSGSHKDIFRAGHRGLIQQDLGAFEPFGLELDGGAGIFHIRTQALSASVCVSNLRRPITSPPGGGR